MGNTTKAIWGIAIASAVLAAALFGSFIIDTAIIQGDGRRRSPPARPSGQRD